jgi:hypothetical protein
MINVNYVWCFALCALAVWRVAHLLAGENGPWDLVRRLRATLGYGMLGRMMDCFYCMSFLIALPPAIWMSSSWVGFLIQWMALSAVACLLEMASQRKQIHVRVKPVSTSYLNKVINGV